MIPNTLSYQTLKKEFPKDCAYYEKWGYASPMLLSRACELDESLRDKLWRDTLQSRKTEVKGGEP